MDPLAAFGSGLVGRPTTRNLGRPGASWTWHLHGAGFEAEERDRGDMRDHVRNRSPRSGAVLEASPCEV
jgi:hypothetical protein